MRPQLSQPGNSGWGLAQVLGLGSAGDPPSMAERCRWRGDRSLAFPLSSQSTARSSQHRGASQQWGCGRGCAFKYYLACGLHGV